MSTELQIAKKLTDMAELEQIRARNADERASESVLGQAGFQAVVLGERDRHLARAGAFLEAAQMTLQSILERTADV